MDSYKRFIFLLLALLGILPGEAQAFTLWDVAGAIPSGWRTKTLSIDLDPGCATSTSIIPALQAAIAAWNGVPTADLTLSIGNPDHSLGQPITAFLPPTASQSYIGNPLIYCDSTFDANNNLSPGPGGSGIPGSDLPPTLSCVNGSKFCPIVGSIILLNFDAGDNTNIDTLYTVRPNLVAVVVAHELGHALGFGHSENVNALMYFNASQKTQLLLAQDDADAISYLYPRNELGGDKLLGCGSLASIGGGRRGSANPQGKRNEASGSSALEGLPTELSILLLACYFSMVAMKRPKSVGTKSG